MFYLIPAWQASATQLGYDLTLQQVKIFSQEQQPYTLLTTTFLPMLTEQLNQAGGLASRYWQAFDAIQDVQTIIGQPLGLGDLPVVQTAERVYGTERVFLYQENQVTARIDFFAGRTISKVTHYQQTHRTAVDWYDSRGFLSRRDCYANNEPSQTFFYNPYGEVVLTIDQQQPAVHIATASQKRFEQSTYDSLNDLIVEVTTKFLQQEQVDQAINIITPIDSALLPVTTRLQQQWPVCQLLTTKPPFNDPSLPVALTNQLPTVFTAPSLKAKLTQWTHNQQQPPLLTKFIPAYPTELDLGESNSLSEQEIFWWVSPEQQPVLSQQLPELIKLLSQQSDLGLTLNVPNQEIQNQIQQVIDQQITLQYHLNLDDPDFQWVQKYLQDKKKNRLFKATINEAKVRKKNDNWPLFVMVSTLLERIRINTKSTITYYQQALAQARMLIDLGATPNIYLQIRAISVGIPQLNANPSIFLDDHDNGIVVRQANELIPAMKFFLTSLDHWNQALINNVAKIEQFSGAEISQEFQKLFAEVTK